MADENGGDPKVGWQYRSGNDNNEQSETTSELGRLAVDSEQDSVNDQPIEVNKTSKDNYNWSAPNTTFNSKTPLWYLATAVVTVAVAGGIYLLTKDKITTIVIIACGILVVFYGAKKPKMVEYAIDGSRFKIAGRYYNFSSYRSFFVTRDGNHLSVALVPLHRFMPCTYINFTTEMEAKIMDSLSNILPRETTRRDVVDTFLKNIGF